MYPELAPIAFLCAASVLLTIPWHWQAGNVATLSVIAWLFVANMIYGIDAVMWHDSIETKFVVWCDISTKILLGATAALPAACLCISMHLERVASLRAVSTSLRDRRRRQMFEGAMCLLFPMVIMALHYVVQGHRFDIIRDFGCRPNTYYSIPGIMIVWVPPLALSTGSLVYSAITLRHFMIRRVTFAAHVNSQSGLSTSHYVRLMLMAIILMFWSLVMSAYSLWFTASVVPLRPWTDWADVHWNFSRIDKLSLAFVPPLIAKGYYLTWWVIPASTIVFVAFFAFGKEAIDHYVNAFRWFYTTILRRSQSPFEKPKKFPSFVKKSFRMPTISKPTFISSSHDAVISLHSVPDSPHSLGKTSSFFATSDSDSTYCPSYNGPKAVGSYSDLKSTCGYPSPAPAYYEKPLPSPPAPITPPPRHPRLVEAFPPPCLTRPPRPLTFPSYEEPRLYMPPMPCAEP